MKKLLVSAIAVVVFATAYWLYTLVASSPPDGESAKAVAKAASSGTSWSMATLWEHLRGWDWRTVVAIAVFATIVGLLSAKKWLPAALTFAGGFLLLAWLGPAAVDRYNSPSAPPGPSYAARTTPALRTADCPGVAQPVEITFYWKELNPGGRCRLIGDFGDKGVEARDRQGVFAAVGWPANRHPSHVRATKEMVYGLYSLCPQTTSGPVKWDCSRL